jgi:hypothetical protein
MIRKIPTLAALALLVFGCSRSGKMQRDQKQYEVVQEGSASGVTSTINAPGETKPPLTDTNVDTTTAFTIPTNPNPMGNETAGTVMSGSAPASAPVAPTSTTWIPASRPPRPHGVPQPRPQELHPSPATDTTMTTVTDTTATDTDVAPLPTTATTDTQRPPKTTTPPDVKKKPDEEPAPPPPPPTDTTGTRGYQA